MHSLFTKLLTRGAIGYLLACGLLITPQLYAAENAAPAKIPVSDFFEYATLSEIKMSPNGKSFVALATGEGGRLVMVSMDIGENKLKPVIAHRGADIENVQWVNNERLVYSLTDRQIQVGEVTRWPGLFAVNKDGSEMRQLTELHRSFVTSHNTLLQKLMPANTFFADTIRSAASDDIFVSVVEQESSIRRSTYNLYRLNTKTGRSTSVHRPGKTLAWIIDKDGTPRIATTLEENTTRIFYRAEGSDEWSQIHSYTGVQGDFEPLQLGTDGSLYVRAYRGENYASLYRYDLKKREFDKQPIVSLGEFDFDGRLLFDQKTQKLVGVRYETDASGTEWLTPELKKLQADVDAVLPGMVNVIDVRSDAPSVLVHSYSDTDPGTYRLYDRATGKITVIGRVNPKIKPEAMSNKDFVRFPARDGLSIPAYLTLPKGRVPKNLPMVLLVHGGPYVRGVHWRFNRETQFLASRGYVVLEPEFRGSQGYGMKHEQAGWKQWGQAMQDDLVDSVKWAVAQGYVDPQRVCIAGASYGGYATLMGLIRDPDIFKCGVNWVGVTDLNLLYDAFGRDAVEETDKYWLPVRVGDQVKDQEMLKANSPLQLAARLKAPVILGYGGVDRRVPIEHGTKFYKAVKTHNPHVEWIEYENEGHGWYFLKNNVDFWTKVENFLDKNIGAQKAK